MVDPDDFRGPNDDFDDLALFLVICAGVIVCGVMIWLALADGLRRLIW